MSESLCSRCVGLCCRYFALPIDNPDTAAEFDNIRWYLAHENVVIFVEDKQWYIGVMNRCKHLLPDNRCEIYETRPRICRGYSTKNCDYHGDEYQFDLLFTSAEQLRIYAEERLSKKAKRKVRVVLSPRPKRANGRSTVRAKKPRRGDRANSSGGRAALAVALAASNGNGNGNGRHTGANGNGKSNGFHLPVLPIR
jgi:uncharacterized protein